MYFSANSGWKASEHTKNTVNSVTYSSIFNDPTSRGFAGKRTDGKPLPKRVNIVILSLPRSGSSFLGDVFNHHPQVLYFFEPLHSLQLKFSGNSLFEFDFSLASYRTLASKFLDDVMFCDFSDDHFTKNIPNNDRRRSLALTSSPFCVEDRGTSLFCDTISSHELEKVCKYNYNVVAMKILTPRIPTVQENKQLLASCSYNEASECRLIHLVRDPRAVFYSLTSLNFFSRVWEPKREQEWFVEKICRQLESDVTLGMATRNSLGARYKLIRFEDLARHPLSAVNELFKFVGLEMMESIKNWVYKSTHSNNTGQPRGVGEPFRTSRDSEQIVFKWRRELNSATVRMIEKYCGRVMNQLGYKFTGTSLDKQLNLNISLID